MKPRRFNPFKSTALSGAAIIFAMSMEQGQAASNTWTGPTGGDWDTTTANWDSPTTWDNGSNDAIFGADLGAIQIVENITANSVTLGTGTSLNITSANTLQISRATASPPPWASITGAGTLSLDTAASFDYGWGLASLGAGFTGTLQIDGGRVYTNGEGSLGGTTAVVVTPGGHLGMWEGGTFPQNFTIAGTGYGESGYESALRMGNGGKTTTITGTVTLSDNATVAAGGTGIISGVVSGESGAGLSIGTSAQGGGIVLTATNTYLGTTTINNGYLYIGNGGATGTLGAGDVVNNSGLVFNRNNANTVTNTITGGGTMYARAGGPVTISGTGANTNNLDIYQSTAILSKTDGVDAVAGSVVIGGGGTYGKGGTLRLAASNQIADSTVLHHYTGHYGGDATFQLMGNNETIGGLHSQLWYSASSVV